MGVLDTAQPQQQQSNLPAASQAQSAAAGSVDIISTLMQQAHEADVQATTAAKAAMSPIAGGHQLPGSAILPHGPQHPLYDIDSSPVVGRHNAQMRGIVNLSKGVSNLVGQVDQAVAQKKTEKLAVNMERLMGAVNATDQAQQVLKSDPGNAAAQDQLKRATAIQDEILGDDKNRKAIGKAYNINFTDPSKNNTPEHAALKQATQSYAQQFTNKLPTQLQQDPMKVAQAQAAAAQAKATHDMLNKLAPSLITEQGQLIKAQLESQTKIQTQEMKDYAAAQRDFAKGQVFLKGVNAHVWGMMEAAKMRQEAMHYEADKRLEGILGRPGEANPKSINALANSLNAFTNSTKLHEQQLANIETMRQSAEESQKPVYDVMARNTETLIYLDKQNEKNLKDKMADALGLERAKMPDFPAPTPGPEGTKKFEGFLSKLFKEFKQPYGPGGSATGVLGPKNGQQQQPAATGQQPAGQQPSTPTAQTDTNTPEQPATDAYAGSESDSDFNYSWILQGDNDTHEPDE